MITLAAICGAIFAIGALFVVGGFRGWFVFVGVADRMRHLIGRVSLRVALALAFGVVALLLTRWPVAAGLAAIFGLFAPAMFTEGKGARYMIERTEAIANWTEMLRDTMAASAGMQSAIEATASAAPIAIREEVANLAARLKHNNVDMALRSFADELDHPTADLVVAALLLASARHARDLGVMLGALAQAARDDATMRLRVEAGRARTKTSVRVVVGFSLALALGMLVLNRSYLDPYDSAEGQLVLAGIGGCFIGAFAWMNKMAAVEVPERILAHVPEVPR